MSGNECYLLDTNALIYLLDKGVTLPRLGLFYSSISKIELLAYPHLDQVDERNIRAALALMQEVLLIGDIVEQTVQIRKTGALKLPDSLILASAQYKNCLLVSDDKKLLNHPGVLSINTFFNRFA